MKKILLLFLGMGAVGAASAQLGRPVPIDSVQYVSEQNLIKGIGDPDNYSYGDQVVIEGVVCKMHPGFYGLSGSSRKSTFLFQKDKRGAWSGVEVMAQPEGSQTLPDLLANTKFYENFIPGLTVKCKVKVSDYQGNTQLLLQDEETEITDLTKTEIEPYVIELDSFKNVAGDDQMVTGEPYEQVYVEFRNVTVVDRTSSGNGRWYWSIQNSRGVKMQIRDVSGFYRTDGNNDSTIKDHNFEPPSEGTSLDFIRGVIIQDNYGYRLAPLVPDDLGLGEFVPPIISNFAIDKPVPTSSDAITLSATITDDNSVAEASIYWALGKDATNFNKVAMSNSNGDDWEGVIPTQANESIIKYYIEAKDDEGNPSYYPNNNGLNSFLVVLDGGLKQIAQIQNTPRTDGSSIYDNLSFTGMALDAVVTATANTLGLTTVQDAGAAWSGIFIKAKAGDGISEWKRGDLVRLTDFTVIEEFGVTYLSDIQFTVQATAQETPAPVKNISIDSLAKGAYDYSEAYEGVLVEWENVVIADTNADAPSYFGEFTFAATTGEDVPQIRVDDNSPYIESNFARDSIQIGQELAYIRGILYYSFGNYKLLPRDKNDIDGYKTVHPISIEEQNLAINLNVFPVPAMESVNVVFDVEKNQKVQYMVVDMTGRTVYSENVSVQAGRINHSISVGQLNSGTYMLKIVGNSLNAATYLIKN